MKNKFTYLTLLLGALITSSALKAAEVSGKALYQGDDARPIGYVMVTLQNTDNNTIQTFKTGADGFYQFTDVANGNYIMTGTTDIAAKNATYYDAMILFMHLIGRYQFTPMQMLASDVNGSGTVSWADYNLFIKNILFKTPFPVDPWRFETVPFTISDMKAAPPHGLGGTCSGDVGGTFVPTANTTPAFPLAQEGVINVANSEAFSTKIITHNNISLTGAGIIINYPSELLQIESVEFKGADYQYNIENGQIRLIWGDPNTAAVNFSEGETILTIHGVSTPAFKEGMSAGFSFEGSTSLMNASGKEETKLSFATPLIKFGKAALRLSNYPNPFKTSTMLNIYCPVAGNATIEVYNINGKLVKSLPLGMLNAGYQDVNLDASSFAKGNYFCKIRIQGKSSEYTDTIRLLKAE
jgi:hypothetical protein